ncbi:protoglobin domain-containing protein [Georgenia subflava]|uniref:Protogloblin ApPgb n=1 Tax=Georgenia subflava TaxID=1622177 RepID=A0A6N7EIY2_9MICO|nr:protoglobin domain-containing protein [Georgenia subflava]MPV37033.1 protogloblin ApPgb [Georgenia subflava]
MATTIPGYDYDAAAPSPVSAEELQQLRENVLFGPDDEVALKQAGDVLSDQVEDVLDVWYDFVGSHRHLLHPFTGADGEPHDDYLARVRTRFGQWIRDTCERPYDARWLAYQEEIALRHTPARKNRTDAVESTSYVPLRHVITLIYPITATIRPFLEKSGLPAETVEAMHEAWRKSVILQVALWSRPYAAQLW